MLYNTDAITSVHDCFYSFRKDPLVLITRLMDLFVMVQHMAAHAAGRRSMLVGWMAMCCYKVICLHGVNEFSVAKHARR